MRRSKLRLFDHLVGGRDKIGRKRKPKRTGSPKVDDKIEFRRCVDRKIARISTAKNAINVIGSLAEMVGYIGPIGDEPSVIGVFPLRINGGYASLRRKVNDCRPVVPENCVRHNEEAIAT
jgi:hypothetical protein